MPANSRVGFDPHTLAQGDVRGMGPVVDTLERLEICRSAAGVVRVSHQFDRDGVCFFCPRRLES